MQPFKETPNTYRKALWAGRITTGLVVLFMTLDGVMKLAKPAPVVEAFVRTGWPVSLAGGLGITLLACTALYLIPSTDILGAILLTGWLGGAVATNLRNGEAWFSHTLFPVYFGVLVWGGLFLRDARLRSILLLRR